MADSPIDAAPTDMPNPVDWDAVLSGEEGEPSAADGFRQLDEAKKTAQHDEPTGEEPTEEPTAEADADATAEAEGEQATEEEAVEEPQPDPNVLQLDSLRSLFPEAVIESGEDVERVVTQYRERSDAFSQFEELADEHPQVLSFIKTLMESGDPVKAAKDAIIPITPPAVPLLEKYCQGLRPGQHLFDFNSPGRLTEEFGHAAEKEVPEKARDLDVHALRRSSGYFWAEHGVSVLDLKALMRHKSVTTTEKYYVQTHARGIGARFEAAFDMHNGR